MDTTISIETPPVAEVPNRPEWTSPEIVKIELKRTFFNSGAAIDNMSGSTLG